MIMRLLQAHFFASQRLELIDHLETGLPVALLLIDKQQVVERRTHMQLGLLELTEKVLGTIEQTGTHVVLTQFEQGLCPLLRA